MEPSFPPVVIMPHDAPLPPPWTFPPVEPVQRITDLSLTMPLSANVTFVRAVAELASEPAIYVLMFVIGFTAMGTRMAIADRPPSISEACRIVNTAITAGAVLTVVSMISPLPIGIAVLIPGLLGAVGAAMFCGVLLFRGFDLVFGWISRWAAAKPALYRSNLWLLVCFLFTRLWFRRTAFVAGLVLIAPAILAHFPPFLLFGVPMIVASLVPRQKWRRQARAEFRMAKALLDRTRLSHPVTP